MHQTPFKRVVAEIANTLHVAKDDYPNEALCGRVLRPEPVTTSKGRKKCSHCSDIIKKRSA